MPHRAGHSVLERAACAVRHARRGRAYGWFKDGTLTGYAFCWEDNAQELLGADDAQLQGLLDVLRRDMLAVTEIGSEIALGVCKWHEKADETAGYMNLMLN